jgi:plastocyanin
VRRATEVTAALLVTLALAGCGGGSDDEADLATAEASTPSSSSSSSSAILGETSTTAVAAAVTTVATTARAAATTAPRAAATTPATNAPPTNPPGTTPATAAPTTTRPPDIVVQNFMFSPATKSVPRSSPVKVENRDGASHTFTPNAAGAWQPCTLSGGQSCTITAPGAPGNYAYRCDFHATMTGTLTVT